MHLTPFHDWHREHGARLVDFAGWEMPIQYSTIVAEHTAVRTQVGLFDISHMGRIEIVGPDAIGFLNFVTSLSVDKLTSGRIRYGFAWNKTGGIADDILVSRLSDQHYFLVVNASNREKLLSLWSEFLPRWSSLELTDRTFTQAMLALQGPQAEAMLVTHLPGCETLKYYRCGEFNRGTDALLVSRTGYTGEDGFEVIGPNDSLVEFWQQLAEQGATPCGLGCRDTLRLEAGMPLYGHELTDQTDPYSADLAFAVSLDKPDFLSAESIRAAAAVTPTRVRIGLQLTGKRVAREEAEILHQDRPVGIVTSGTFSPTLQSALAMGYVDAKSASLGTELQVDVRGKLVPARVVELPFYRRK